MLYYTNEIDEVIEALNSTPNGISGQEAAARLAKNGPNELAQPRKASLLQRFLKEIADPMILILLVAAVISAVTAVIENESFADVFIILFVVVLNSILGVYQESKAEEAIEALQKMTAAKSKVIRDGQKLTVPSSELVVGDLILLEAGDAVPADARIVTAASLKIEEASLTGESEPVTKFIEMLKLRNESEAVPLGDRKNMCYMGSTVVYGRGAAIVTATGMATEMGKIAASITMAEDELTPLQRNMNELSAVLTKLVVGICVFIFAFSVIRNGSFSGEAILDTFMIAISLAVAAIPEGLVAVVTIVLSIGVTNMSKRNAIIRKLTAVETLGSAQVICSDKTGTLTQNKMTVVRTFTSDEEALARIMALCSDAELAADSNADKPETIGEPTEAALIVYALKNGIHKNRLAEQHPRLGEAPFDSMRKMMSTIHEFDGKIIQFSKGAPDEILKKCTKVLHKGQTVPLTDEIREEIQAANTEMASDALRVLAGAIRIHDELPKTFEPQDLERDLTFVGMTGMIDPVRPEVGAAIIECYEAGITPVMITGDHKGTAVAIAKQLGILKDGRIAITGAELNEISEDEFEKKIERIGVYARVQPEHKTRIVKCWRRLGRITAMTGDGVNDAPAIKHSDIGVGMGITGTDVTKNVADMVLADDNFATIVSAVEEGRRIFDNIQKVIQFLLSANLAEIIAIFVATIFGFTILKPVHLLWINLITDSMPALALGIESPEDDLMKRQPRDPKTHVLGNGIGGAILYQGIIIAALTFISYLIGHYVESGVWEIAQSPDGMTMAFTTLSLAEIVHSFNIRSRKNSIFKIKTINLPLIGAAAIALILTTVVLYVPILAQMFEFQMVSLNEFAIAVGLALLMVPAIEIGKVIERKFDQKRK